MFHSNVTCQTCGEQFSYESQRSKPKAACSNRCRQAARILTPAQKAAKVERIRQWRLANPELNKQQRDAHSEANRERLRQEAREYHAANREVILARAAARRADDPELFAAKQRERYALDPEAILQTQRYARETNGDAIRARDRARYWANRDNYLEARRAYEKALRASDPAGYAAARAKGAAAWRENNPEAAAAKAARDRAIRRARLAQVGYEDFSNREIFDRDGWVCHICELRVMKHRKFPDKWSASLDHVVPISKGGGHTRDNVRLSHLRCNAMKHDRDWIEVDPLEQAG